MSSIEKIRYLLSPSQIAITITCNVDELTKKNACFQHMLTESSFHQKGLLSLAPNKYYSVSAL